MSADAAPAARPSTGPLSAAAKQRIAGLVQRAPWLAILLTDLLYRTRPRFTAGVVAVILSEQGDVLLVEHIFHARTPWGLPGGWLDRGESPEAGLVRELREELGLQVSILRPLLVDTGSRPAHLDIAYLCRAENTVQHLCAELLDYRWVRADDLPPMMPFHRRAVDAGLARRREETGETNP